MAIEIIIKSIVGSNAISMNTGRQVRERIREEWDLHEKITLNFEGVKIYASPFFNASVGSLLKDNSIENLQAKLEFKLISDHGKNLLNLVIGNAIKFYNDTEGKTTDSLDKIKKDF
tara:strand:+ start:5917 stop:6264 length:348 start_codon:yes stop_codon:yes gene_type:complete